MDSQTENNSLPSLTRRQEDVLALIIRSYSDKPEPISSKHIAEKLEQSVSSATVRNEMAHLEELGYLQAIHTSSGRVPTAQGYRYFVRGLLNSGELSHYEQQQIERKFNELPNVLEQWLRQSVVLLSRMVHTASLITPPVSETNRFKHLELISLQGRLTLMVLVLQGGTLHQRMINLDEPFNQQELGDVVERINALCVNLTATQIRVKMTQMDAFAQDIVSLATSLMDASQVPLRMIYRDGLSEIIQSFPDTLGAQQAVRIFEEHAFMDMILSELLLPLIDSQDVQVIIAGNGQYAEIDKLGLVLSRYGVPGKMSGAVGVLGPTHIDYDKAINTVRFVSHIMSDRLSDLYDNVDDSSQETDIS